LKRLQRFEKPQNVFVIITAGKNDESGFSVSECVNILRKKNCQIVYSAVVEMPINWTTNMNPPSKLEAQTIIDKGVQQAREIGNGIVNGVHKYHILIYLRATDGLAYIKNITCLNTLVSIRFSIDPLFRNY
jgi:hypothetical protein